LKELQKHYHDTNAFKLNQMVADLQNQSLSKSCRSGLGGLMPEKKYGLSEDWPDEVVNKSALKPSNHQSYNDLCQRKTTEN
jgi:hypothetical protein